MEDEKVIIYLLFYSSSFLLVCFICEMLLPLLKAKTGMQLKLFRLRNIGKIVYSCCFLLHFYFFIYERQLYTSARFLECTILAIIFIGMRQILGYNNAEINTSLDETKSIGAYWAQQAYDAFYKIVLEDIKERTTSFEDKHNIQFFCNKLLVVIPLSCHIEGTLTEKDEDIKHFGTLKVTENDAGGNINRNFKNPVYWISSKDVYIVAEFSTPVKVLWESRSEMKKENLPYIRDCYIKTLRSLVQGSPCIIITYDDIEKAESLGSCILSAIEKDRKENDFIA